MLLLPLMKTYCTFPASFYLTHIRRCIDFVFYYPVQPIPFGICGMYFCDGTLDETVSLDADSDFNRTYGIVETCAESGEVGASVLSTRSYTH